MRISQTAFVPSRLPMVTTENDAFFVVSNSASAAAIFMGCTCVMALACRSPLPMATRDATSSTQAPKRAAKR